VSLAADSARGDQLRIKLQYGQFINELFICRVV